ncbi:MAG TPA: cytochrome b/b6 domain-containing protein, partial [Stellaceae bacterium]|nr:cytochrome b/b6 domain-containing protein [Stellaceae bacterium]
RNAVQKVMYIGVVTVIVLTVLSGLSIWKPVQFQELTALFGGYDVARYVHFFCMSAIVLFVAVHLSLTVLVPKVLPPMITGRARIDMTPDLGGRP